MVGYVGEAIAAALKSWPALKQANVIPVRATDGNSVVVNTPIPAIAVYISGDDNDGAGDTFFGGGIRQHFDLLMCVVLPITNYSFSPDLGRQRDVLDLSDEVIRCMERTDVLDDLKTRHDFNFQYVSTSTETTYATRGANSVTVEVHKIRYKGSVEFDLYNKDEVKPITDVNLKKVDIKIQE